MYYNVRYRDSKSFFWKKITEVIGDGVVPETNSRYFIRKNDERIEIPSTYIFKFSKERTTMILKNAEKETGNKIPTTIKD